MTGSQDLPQPQPTATYEPVVAVRRDDLQALLEAAQAADEAGLLGKCQADPCPACTAMEAADRVLRGAVTVSWPPPLERKDAADGR